jgi:hypothetical protein
MTAQAALPRELIRTKAWSDDLPDELNYALDDFDFASTPEFQPLAELSAATELVGIYADAESTVIQEDCLIAPGTVEVKLVYEPNSKEPVEIPDSYPARIFFTLEDGKVLIDHVEPDVSSFYA